MDNLILRSRDGRFSEIIDDFDFGTFRYEYEQNNERSISFTAYKTAINSDIFDSLVNENYIVWRGQRFVIKSTELKYENGVITNNVIAKHISMEFQNHYISKDMAKVTLNSDSTSDEKIKMTLRQFLAHTFKNNRMGFKYKVYGKWNVKRTLESIEEKNGLEMLIEGASTFGYIIFADNKMFHIYHPTYFYKRSDEILVYRYNTSEVSAKVTTTDFKTYIKGYGKRKTKKETQNYHPVKPKDLTYRGSFIKSGTWRTEQVGASYSSTFNCKWGNETLVWSRKRMSKGGMMEIFVDGKSKGKYSCYAKNATTDKITLAKGLKKGKHTFKAVFKGAKSGVDYKKSKPCMYVGTPKSNVLNLTAKISGEDVYKVKAEYKSPKYYPLYGKYEAPTIYSDSITSKSSLIKKLKSSLNDEPTVEVSTSYYGTENIKENHTIRFIHQPIGFNVDLKVVKLVEYHPYTHQPKEVEFSNARKDIVRMQQKLNQQMRNANKGITHNMETSNIRETIENYGDIVGSVLLDE